MISGLMVLKNGLTLGYPFIEAILSVIDYVDEMVVVECESTDKTLDALCGLLNKHMDKLKIKIHPWDFSGKQGEKIGEIQTISKRYCNGDTILCVQADEIWDSESIKLAVSLPKSYPLVGLFNFPFDHVVGNFQFRGHNYDWAVRMFKNDPRVESEADGWTWFGQMPYLSVELPAPIFHSGSIGWRNNYTKIVNHGTIYKDNKLYQSNSNEYKKRLEENNPEEFLLKRESSFNIPEILKPFLGAENYYVRKELYES
ncbi:MAG: hypothetical protein KCHDKBKB_00779 [Elusimicrobia bacterium]|nr:hypothetical protein [Elusimicrobiota bacterium]